jgi:hypothetical protein
MFVLIDLHTCKWSVPSVRILREPFVRLFGHQGRILKHVYESKFRWIIVLDLGCLCDDSMREQRLKSPISIMTDCKFHDVIFLPLIKHRNWDVLVAKWTHSCAEYIDIASV